MVDKSVTHSTATIIALSAAVACDFLCHFRYRAQQGNVQFNYRSRQAHGTILIPDPVRIFYWSNKKTYFGRQCLDSSLKKVFGFERQKFGIKCLLPKELFAF